MRASDRAYRALREEILDGVLRRVQRSPRSSRPIASASPEPRSAKRSPASRPMASPRPHRRASCR